MVYIIHPNFTSANMKLLYKALRPLMSHSTLAGSSSTLIGAVHLIPYGRLLQSASSPFLRSIAFSVYNKVRRFYLEPPGIADMKNSISTDGVGTLGFSRSLLLYEPLFILSALQSKSTTIQEGTSTSMYDQTLHCCYLLTQDRKYVAVCWMDALGEFINTLSK